MLNILWRILRTALITVFVLLSLYAAAFAIACTWGAWWLYTHTEKFLDEVRVLQYSDPKESSFMVQYRREHPDIPIVQYSVRLDSLGTNLQKAVIAAEDAGFRFHPGFDIRAVADALDANRARGKNAFGASTITQQLAKNLFLNQERSWERKGKELGYALLMEHYLGKDRILELYLNYAQWGKGIFGAQAACSTYFQKPCNHISMDQAISLAAMLASPEKYTPASTSSRFMSARRAMIWSNLYGPKDSLEEDSSAGGSSSQDSTEVAPIDSGAGKATPAGSPPPL